jgi:hypothetical protein
MAPAYQRPRPRGCTSPLKAFRSSRFGFIAATTGPLATSCSMAGTLMRTEVLSSARSQREGSRVTAVASLSAIAAASPATAAPRTASRCANRKSHADTSACPLAPIRRAAFARGASAASLSVRRRATSSPPSEMRRSTENSIATARRLSATRLGARDRSTSTRWRGAVTATAGAVFDPDGASADQRDARPLSNWPSVTRVRTARRAASPPRAST